MVQRQPNHARKNQTMNTCPYVPAKTAETCIEADSYHPNNPKDLSLLNVWCNGRKIWKKENILIEFHKMILSNHSAITVHTLYEYAFASEPFFCVASPVKILHPPESQLASACNLFFILSRNVWCFYGLQIGMWAFLSHVLRFIPTKPVLDFWPWNVAIDMNRTWNLLTIFVFCDVDVWFLRSGFFVRQQKELVK